MFPHEKTWLQQQLKNILGLNDEIVEYILNSLNLHEGSKTYKIVCSLILEWNNFGFSKKLKRITFLKSLYLKTFPNIIPSIVNSMKLAWFFFMFLMIISFTISSAIFADYSKTFQFLNFIPAQIIPCNHTMKR